MTQKILDGKLPMHLSRCEVQDLRDAGHLKVTFGPLMQNQRTYATVTEVTTLGRAEMRYLGSGFDTRR